MFDLNKALNDCYYSDLYKDATGCRPRNVFFASQEELDKDVEYLQGLLERNLDEQKNNEAHAEMDFEVLLKETQALVVGSTEQDAFRVLLQSEDMEKSFEFYGTEIVEHHFGLAYGYLRDRFSNAKTLAEALGE